MHAHCGLACSMYLLVLVSVVTLASQKLEDSKYTTEFEVKEASNAAQLNSWDNICDQVPHNILKCSSKKNVSILTCNCVTYDGTEQIFQVGKCSSITMGYIQCLPLQEKCVKNFKDKALSVAIA